MLGNVALPVAAEVEKGEMFLVAGSTHGQAHRFFNSESCLLTSLCILVEGLGGWEQVWKADG